MTLKCFVRFIDASYFVTFFNQPKNQSVKIRILMIALLFAVTNAFAQVPSYVPTNGLVGWWPFNGNANDESGNGNNGTVNGATLTSDRNGNSNSAYYFSGAGCGTRIDLNLNTSSISNSNEYTISIWVFKSGQGCMIHPRILEFFSCSFSFSVRTRKHFFCVL